MPQRTIQTRVWFGYAVAVSLVLLPLAVAVAAPLPAGRVELVLILVIAIAVSARLWGPGPGLLAAVASYIGLAIVQGRGAAELNPDQFRRTIEEVTYIATTLFLAVQVGQLRQERERAKAGETAALTLSHLSAKFVPDASVREVGSQVVEAVRELSGATWAGIMGQDAYGSPSVFAQSVADGASSDIEAGILIRYAWAQGVAVGLSSREGDEISAGGAMPRSVPYVTATGSAARRTDIALPLVASDGRMGGLLYIGPSARGRPYAPAVVGQLVLISRQVSLFGERQRLKSDVAHAQATREAEQLRANLMSSLSHELKTPIASMSATISGLLEERNPSRQRVRAELGTVEVDLTRLDRSIGELLDLSALETDAWRSAKDWHDLGDVAGSVVGSLLEGDRARIVLDLPEEPVLAFVDFVQVSRAVHHIVENALAYSDAGQRVVVSVSRSGARALITVTDRGPGIPNSERARIFEKFYRGEASARVPQGTGLGLAISAQIVSRHGGAVRVEPARPRGARFVLEFPDGGLPNTTVAPREEETA